MAYPYDAAYRAVSETDALGETESYAWDGSDGRASVVDRNRDETSFVCEARNDRIVERWTLSNPKNAVVTPSF